MPGFKQQISHAHVQALAVERLKNFAEVVKEKYANIATQSESNWQENTLTFFVVAMGLRIDGQLIVQDYLAVVEVKYPFAAALFAGRIEETITSHLREALH
jgi:Putative polyhydroxyalkanoic acid system protein (PHA_gran_rgn)